MIRRRGFGSLVLVLGALMVLSAVGLLQRGLSGQVRSEVHRTQLTALARLQARSGIEELLVAFRRRANQPGSPLFQRLREALDGSWEELDLTGDLPGPGAGLEPRWGKLRAPPSGPGAAGRPESYRVLLRAPRAALDPVGTEEYSALLEVRVVSSLADASARVRWAETAHHEVRLVLPHPPRPFDQVSLLVGNLASITDVSEANRLRTALIDELQEIRGRDPAGNERLRAIQAGIPSRAEMERRAPLLPRKGGGYLGFDHLHRATRTDLDPVEEMARSLREARGGGASTDGEATYRRVAAASRGLDAFWRFQRSGRVLRDDPELEPYLRRLTPDFFRDRIHLRLPEGDPRLSAWKAGEALLEGVVDLSEHRSRIELRGEQPGRTLLLIGPGGALLDGAGGEPDEGSSLCLVSLGGDVRVRGRTHASVIMLGGTLTVEGGAELVGRALVPRGELVLEGVLEEAHGARLAYPPSRSLAEPGPGPYVVALAPTPLFSTGELR